MTSATESPEGEVGLRGALLAAQATIARLRRHIVTVPSTPVVVPAGLRGRSAAAYRAGWEAAGREYRAALGVPEGAASLTPPQTDEPLEG